MLGERPSLLYEFCKAASCAREFRRIQFARGILYSRVEHDRGCPLSEVGPLRQVAGMHAMLGNAATRLCDTDCLLCTLERMAAGDSLRPRIAVATKESGFNSSNFAIHTILSASTTIHEARPVRETL
jgi:hypothetical protein